MTFHVSEYFFMCIMKVMDMQTRKSVKFLCNDWLDITEGDGTITRSLGEASPDDLNEFDFVFELFLQQGMNTLVH